MTTDPEMLAHAADRAIARPFYLGNLLDAIARAHGDTWMLRELFPTRPLPISPAYDWSLIRLCRKPTSWSDCLTISERFDCSAVVLADWCGLSPDRC